MLLAEWLGLNENLPLLLFYSVLNINPLTDPYSRPCVISLFVYISTLISSHSLP